MAIAMEAEIVGDTDKMELLSDRLLELSFVVEEVIYWPEPCSDCATIVRSRSPISSLRRSSTT